MNLRGLREEGDTSSVLETSAPKVCPSPTRAEFPRKSGRRQRKKKKPSLKRLQRKGRDEVTIDPKKKVPKENPHGPKRPALIPLGKGKRTKRKGTWVRASM